MSVNVCLSASIILLALDTFFFKDYTSAIIESIGLTICLVFFILSRRLEHISKLVLPFIFFLLLLINAGWYFGGGLNTGNVLLLLLIFYLSLVMVKKKYRLKLVILFFANLGVMMIWEFLDFGIREELIDLREEMIASDILIFITFSIGIYFILFVKGKYEKLKKELEFKNNQLIEVNHELSSINENLEKIAQQRTNQIKDQNKKIIDYAFMNSHKVRGPLARILGLTELFSQNIIHKSEIPSSLNEIKNNAVELDHQIKEINILLENEDLIEE